MSRAVRLGALLVAGLACGCLRDVALGALPRADGGGVRVDSGAALDVGGSEDGAVSSSADAGVERADVAPPGDLDAALADAGLDTYALTLPRLAELTCVDALGGHEPDFAGLSATDCGLVEGVVTLSRTSSRSWTVAGPALAASLGRSSVRVAAGLFPEQPPELLVSTFPLSGAGPRGTSRRSGALGFDRATATAARVDGFVGVELSNTDDSGSCFVTFDVVLTR